MEGHPRRADAAALVRDFTAVARVRACVAHHRPRRAPREQEGMPLRCAEASTGDERLHGRHDLARPPHRVAAGGGGGRGVTDEGVAGAGAEVDLQGRRR